MDEPDPLLFEKVKPRVSEVMNENLMRPYMAKGVRKSLFSVEDMKSPGSDGLRAFFFRKCWDILGESLIVEVLNTINNKVVLNGWNDTVIVLIPKIGNPELITLYRPISLCNVLCKVIFKMVACRLKYILDEIISPV